MRRELLRGMALITACTVIMTAQVPVHAAEAGLMIEEITVTATRREESLMDVPVSVTFVDREQILRQDLNDLDQLSNFIPGFNVVEGGEQTGISIRGFGSELNFGVDPAVGQFIDGVFLTRERQFRGKFLDIDSVQVLKGPQSTLFGKNTTAGAVIIRTARPEGEFDAYLDGDFEPRAERQSYEAMVNVPITDTFAMRVASRVSRQQGFFQNTLTGDSEEDVEDEVVRASLAWEPRGRFSAWTKVEWSELDRVGRNFQMATVNPGNGLTGALQACCGVPVLFNVNDPAFDARINRRTSKQRETSHTDGINWAMELAYELPWGTLTSTTGFSEFESNDQRDADWSPSPYLFEPITQDFEQWNTELTFRSPVGERFDYQLGVFWQTNDFFVDRRTDINLGDGVFYVPPPNNRIANLRFLDQSEDTVSVFSSGTWHVTDAWHLTVGLRWERIEKTAEDRTFVSEFGTTRFLDPENNPEDAELIAGVEASPFFAVPADRADTGKRTESFWSPSVKLSWDMTEDVMFYGSFMLGHKAGGFDANDTTSAAAQDTSFEFEDETSRSFELGGKMQLVGGRVGLDFALFRTEFEDKIDSTFLGDGFVLGSAGEAISQGVEARVLWNPVEWLSLRGALLYQHAEFEDFENAACGVGQRFELDNIPGTPTAGCSTDPVTGVQTQDLSGRRFAPSQDLSLGMSAEKPLPWRLLGHAWTLHVDADSTYHDAARNDKDPAVLAWDRWWQLQARIGVESGDGRWSLGVVGRNLLDEEAVWFVFDQPGGDTVVGNQIGSPVDPRSFVVQARYSFRAR